MTRAARPAGLTLADLVADPHNRRRRTPRNAAMLTASLQAVGAARSIVIDERNEILAGNGVAESAAGAGITKLHVVDVDGDTLVAVRRSNLTDDQKRALALYDNRTAELAEWNTSQLQADVDDGLDLRAFWSPDEEAALVSRGAADDVLSMAATDPPDEGTAAAAATSTIAGETYHTFSCPLTVDQERTVRAALKTARDRFHVTTTGEALVAALRAWAGVD